MNEALKDRLKILCVGIITGIMIATACASFISTMNVQPHPAKDRGIEIAIDIDLINYDNHSHEVQILVVDYDSGEVLNHFGYNMNPDNHTVSHWIIGWSSEITASNNYTVWFVMENNQTHFEFFNGNNLLLLWHEKRNLGYYIRDDDIHNAWEPMEVEL